jgi:hypothetical protein
MTEETHYTHELECQWRDGVYGAWCNVCGAPARSFAIQQPCDWRKYQNPPLTDDDFLYYE